MNEALIRSTFPQASMSKFDNSSEKQKDGSDSAAFKGKRHPFLERGVDWKRIEKKRYGMDGDQIADSADAPIEIEITGLDEKSDRIEKCVAAVKQLYTNPDMWYRIRDCLIAAYREAGPKQKASRKALRNFTDAVNKRLGSSGEIFVDRAIGLQARDIAKIEGVSNPELSAHVSVRHSGGLLGPIGVCFTNRT